VKPCRHRLHVLRIRQILIIVFNTNTANIFNIISFAIKMATLHVTDDAVVLSVGHQTCDSQVAGSSMAGHHCIVALGKLLKPVCLCHQAV